MDLNEYQEQAMTTNLRPKVFTEDQVRKLVAMAYVRGGDYAAQIAIETAREWADYDIAREATVLNSVIYPLLGLLEEAGEMAGKVKKIIRDQDGNITDANIQALNYENGDALWYLSAIADALGYQFHDVAAANLLKLADRARRGVLRGSGDNR